MPIEAIVVVTLVALTFGMVSLCSTGSQIDTSTNQLTQGTSRHGVEL